MKYALISDIHSNLPALEAVLADIERREDVGAIYHLGDLVGYAPWPNETSPSWRSVEYRGSRATTTRPWPPTTSTAAARPKLRVKKNSRT
jgi:calcineurin-like phosphoesterase family protein